MKFSALPIGQIFEWRGIEFEKTSQVSAKNLSSRSEKLMSAVTEVIVLGMAIKQVMPQPVIPTWTQKDVTDMFDEHHQMTINILMTYYGDISLSLEQELRANWQKLLEKKSQ